MNYIKIANRVRARDFFKIFLIVGFVLVSTRLENFHYQSEDYYDPIQVKKELVTNEQSNEEHILWGHDETHVVSSARINLIQDFHSFKNSINTYNLQLLTRFKALISDVNYHSTIISIIQMSNIWHKSSKKEPVIFD